jgi:hypothetical protein
MTNAEILTLAAREAQRLTEENDHSAAIIMSALMDALRAKNDLVDGVRVKLRTTTQDQIT